MKKDKSLKNFYSKQKNIKSGMIFFNKSGEAFYIIQFIQKFDHYLVEFLLNGKFRSYRMEGEFKKNNSSLFLDGSVKTIILPNGKLIR